MRTTVLLALLLVAPVALAQEHEHKAGDGLAVALHDGPPGGRAVVGGWTHFGFALLSHEGSPLDHRDASFELVQDGVVVFTTNDTHEYDGLFSFDHLFLRPGPYVVRAASEETTTIVFQGEAVLPEDPVASSVELQTKPLPGTNLVDVTISVVDPAGKIIPHSDVIVESRARSTGALGKRYHLHLHDEPIAFTQAFAPGEHVVRVLAYNAYPSSGPDVMPSIREFTITGATIALPAAPPLPRPLAPTVLDPVGDQATKDGYRLRAMYDPQAQVGVGQPIRIAATIANADGFPEAHVDLEFVLHGPRGLVFSSTSLHEYDGVFEHLLVPALPGHYEGTLTAHLDTGALAVPIRFQVLPPVAASEAGPAMVSVKGLDALTAGEPSELVFRVAGPSGAVAHSEVDVTIDREGELPLYQFKLHTHGSGETRATLRFPEAGDWRVRVDPLPTRPQPVTFQGPEGMGKPIVFTATVAPSLLDDAVGALSTDGQNPVPTPALAAVLALGVAGLLLRRRL